VSSRERLPILDRFFVDIFAHTGSPRSLLDLACGLNPLSLPWMGLGRSSSGALLDDGEVVYHAYDIDTARVAFLNRYLDLAGVHADARTQDVICAPPVEQADVALLLKSSTCLERQKRGVTLALLDALDVSYAVVTFPVKSLGRREKGMPAHYAQTFAEMLASRPWPVIRLDFATEQVFVVDKRQ
jgi:16S rRNA (guanine(1405)-N(7))-methyltransferase